MHSDAAASFFDVAVIGTGMGGATLGHALARAGLRVAFIEKGHGDLSAAAQRLAGPADDPESRLRSGNWPTPLTACVDGVQSRFFAPLGCGAGGSSLLYAAALERFDPADFAPATDGPLPCEGWPVSYAELEPYYREAEALYRVRGSPDPLSPESASGLAEAPPLSACDAHFLAQFRAAGLHPYRLHVGIDYKPGCRECLGHVCLHGCKRDARRTCLEPALATGNAVLIDRCEVLRLEADARAVRSIVGRRDGQPVRIGAAIVVLAAGAYFSPALLLRSANEHWPEGLANRSGMVGRNLMFHLSDLIAVWPRHRHSTFGPRKTLACRDFYRHLGQRYGVFQSTGFSAGHANIEHYLRSWLERSRWRWCKPLRPLLRLAAHAAALALGQASIFGTIMEDLPYPDNRVLLDPDEPSGIRFCYTLSDELLERHRIFRELIRRRLAAHRLFMINRDPMLNYGHPCGTCRSGRDPASSVLDRDNKAHDIDNLYVVDASFMPTSGGANPALTIAANALRVAGRIAAAAGAQRDRAAMPAPRLSYPK